MTLDELVETPKRKPPKYTKKWGVLVVAHPDGRIDVTVSNTRIDVEVLRLPVKEPKQLRPLTWLAATVNPSLQMGVHFVSKPRRQNKAWKVIDHRMAKRLGITEELRKTGRVPNGFYDVKLPPDILPSRNKYSENEIMQMNELLLQGAVWCEYRKRHFLAVLPS